MMTSARFESSVMTSLSELARIERERVREEEATLARNREELACATQARADAMRREEEAERAAESERARERARADIETRVRAEAREQAAAYVARTARAANVQLEADNAARAHELMILRMRADASAPRAVWLLVAILALVCAGAATTAFEVAGYVRGLEHESSRLRDEAASAARDHDLGDLAMLGALDRRHAALRAWRTTPDVSEAAAAAATARAAIEGKASRDAALEGFALALDRLEAADLASERAEAAHQREAALDRLRSELTKPGRPSPTRAHVVAASAQPDCRPGDPICGVPQAPL
jgi:hypothetical protein